MPASEETASTKSWSRRILLRRPWRRCHIVRDAVDVRCAQGDRVVLRAAAPKVIAQARRARLAVPHAVSRRSTSSPRLFGDTGHFSENAPHVVTSSGAERSSRARLASAPCRNTSRRKCPVSSRNSGFRSATIFWKSSLNSRCGVRSSGPRHLAQNLGRTTRSGVKNLQSFSALITEWQHRIQPRNPRRIHQHCP